MWNVLSVDLFRIFITRLFSVCDFNLVVKNIRNINFWNMKLNWDVHNAVNDVTRDVYIDMWNLIPTRIRKIAMEIGFAEMKNIRFL